MNSRSKTSGLHPTPIADFFGFLPTLLLAPCPAFPRLHASTPSHPENKLHISLAPQQLTVFAAAPAGGAAKARALLLVDDGTPESSESFERELGGATGGSRAAAV